MKFGLPSGLPQLIEGVAFTLLANSVSIDGTVDVSSRRFNGTGGDGDGRNNRGYAFHRLLQVRLKPDATYGSKLYNGFHDCI